MLKQLYRHFTIAEATAARIRERDMARAVKRVSDAAKHVEWCDEHALTNDAWFRPRGAGVVVALAGGTL